MLMPDKKMELLKYFENVQRIFKFKMKFHKIKSIYPRRVDEAGEAGVFC
jgi:hypothetical protein